MFEHILDCPKCGKRFHYEHEGNDFPENIVCSECGESSESGEFEVLLLCHECHVKIKVPLSMLDNEDNCCPKCGAVIHNDRLSHLSQAGTTIAGFPVAKEKKRMLNNGDIFDKYQIISFLGRGGMAEVYLAEHLLLKQKCALKLMQRSLDQDDNPVFIKRFVREAKLTHSLSHPNIVKVFDAGSDFKTGYLFLAMEYVEGQTLHEIIHEKDFSEDELLEILSVMANALKVLENAKVVHRDIKPSNIMYTKDGVYKLMDLGIAKMESNHQAGDMTLTMEQSTIGTPGYASPEQCSSAHLVDVRSDIFSLGAALYHAASGRLPFSGESPVVTILNTMQKDPEPLREFRPDLSDEFIGLVEKMMKKKPSERFQNMDELIEAIGKVEARKTLPAPVRKFKTVVTAIGTTIFANKKDKEEKNAFKLTRHLGKLLIMLLVAAVAVPNIFYVINHMNDTQPVGGYVDFMKNFFVSFDVKKETPVTQTKTPVQPPKPGKKSEESIETLISNAKPMSPDPDPALQSVVDSGKKMYVKVALAAPLTPRLLYQHDFTKVSPKVTGAAPDMIHDGLLDLSRNPNASVQCDDLIGFTNWSVFLHFELFEREKAPIFSASGLELFVLNGTLRILYAGQYVDTRISPELGTWLDLTVSVNNSNGVLQLFSGDLLLRSYRFTPSRERTASVVKFYSPLLRKKMTGRIDYVALYKNSLKIVPLQPSRRERFRTSEKRCPDGIALKPIDNARKVSVGPKAVPAVPKTIEEIRSDFKKSWERKEWGEVEKLLKTGTISANMKFPHGVSLLSSACYNVDFDRVKLLLDNGADPNLRDGTGKHPLGALREQFNRTAGDEVPYTPKQKEATKIIIHLLRKGADPGASFDHNTIRHGIIAEYIFRHPRPDEFVSAVLPFLSRMKEPQWERFILLSREKGRISDENKYRIMAKCPREILAKYFGLICFSMPLSPELLQNYLKSGSRDVLFRVFVKEKEPLLALLIRSRQPEEIIEAALKAGAYTVCLNWKNKKGATIERMAPPQLRPLLKQYAKKRRRR